MEWKPPPKPIDLTESRLITAILDGTFPPDSRLPAERELAQRLGVTRPTLREALQRMACDGWIEIHQGRSTRVRNYWNEGNLGVLGAIARHQQNLPPDFVPNLLIVRSLLAPAYARQAISLEPERALKQLEICSALPDDAALWAQADWELHRQLTIGSGNPIFTLILNGFRDLYLNMARRYFQDAEARNLSRQFYAVLRTAAETNDPDTAENITRSVMLETILVWQRIEGEIS